ncbi:hypothetical protein CEXT_117261 [Caerostris extrusa]|uniref:C2H2-type domain-containing protein n=1 Tax=Caerostris extrusa TaxID=172846 RepID=A0AAV4TC31_CAEEX|nr:hypothetical protein CEXT_117261 [Caerostris extrusa]
MRFNDEIKKKIQPRPNREEVGHERSAIKLRKIRKPREKLFPCKVCSKKCPSPSSLKKHILTHTEEKTFSCKICGKMFSEKGNRDVHTLTFIQELRGFSVICVANRTPQNSKSPSTQTGTSGR